MHYLNKVCTHCTVLNSSTKVTIDSVYTLLVNRTGILLTVIIIC